MHDVVAGKFRRLSRQIARSRPGDKLPCASLCARLSEVHHQPYGADDDMSAFKHVTFVEIERHRGIGGCARGCFTDDI
jgi:hypothetical protein